MSAPASFETLWSIYEAQQSEWQAIRDELGPRYARRGVVLTAYDVTREQRKRMLRRGLGERLVEVGELEEAHARDPAAAEAFLEERARKAAPP